MKNLLIFISPAGGFPKEHEELTKMQIDNSLELGWKPEDILLVTNFDYEYRGIKAVDEFVKENNLELIKLPRYT